MAIEKFDESPIQDDLKLAESHHKLVEKLRRALVMGQSHFLAAGKYLYEIKDKNSYKYEDASQEITWQEFLQRPDIPLPGSTAESRVRCAQALLRVYKTFKVDHQYEDEKLAEIGWTKLDMVAAHMLAHPKKDVDNMLANAKELTTRDLQKEFGTGDLKELMDCKHEETVTYQLTKCTKCKEIIKRE
jgi:hypothetical protein